MPVILSDEAAEAWLSPKCNVENMLAAFGPYHGLDLEWFPVTKRVNSMRCLHEMLR
jgi:putative SOS response-associated peptidase YedK